jgi:hypothetical protein
LPFQPTDSLGDAVLSPLLLHTPGRFRRSTMTTTTRTRIAKAGARAETSIRTTMKISTTTRMTTTKPTSSGPRDATRRPTPRTRVSCYSIGCTALR